MIEVYYLIIKVVILVDKVEVLCMGIVMEVDIVNIVFGILVWVDGI